MPVSAGAVDARIPMSGREVAPIDVTGNAIRSYQLAGMVSDQEEKERKRNEGLNDEKAIRGYLSSGGDFSTPEGIQQGLQYLKDKVSPDKYDQLLLHGEKMRDYWLKARQTALAFDEKQRQDYMTQNEQIMPMLEKLNSDYQTNASTKGEQFATEQFNKDKQGLLGTLSGLQIGGAPRFSPDIMRDIGNMTPQTVPFAIKASKYHHQMLVDQMNDAKAQAIAGGGDIYQGGGATFKVTKAGQSFKQTDTGDWEPAPLPSGAKKVGSTSGQGSGIQYTPDALNNISVNHMFTGQWPSRMTADDKRVAANREAELAKFMGLGPTDLALLPVEAKARQKALTNLENLAGSVGAFENNMKLNVSRALDNLSEVKTTDIPLLNKWVQAGMGATTGLPPPLARLAVNLKAVASEYTKLSSGSLGNTQIGERALLEVEKLFSKADNPQSLRATLGEVMTDAGYRVEGIKQKQTEILGGMKDLLKGADSAASNAPAAAGSGARPASPPPATGPAIDDTDRGRILNEELKKSTTALNALDPKSPTYATDKSRIQEDIAALRREMAADKVKDTSGSGGGVTPLRNAKGWKLMTDAKNRKAYVSPDGKSYEVVK